MSEDKAKVVDYKDGKVQFALKKDFDFNDDNEPVAGIDVTFWVSIEELPDEVYDAWKSRKDKK